MTIVRLTFTTLLILASLGFVYMAAKTLKERQRWETQSASLTKQLEQKASENDLLVNGDAKAQMTPIRPNEGRPLSEQFKDEKPGLRQLLVALGDMLVDRGPMWDQCHRGQVDAATGEVKVSIDAPTPHGIKDGTMLFVFEKADLTDPDAPSGGQFLGEFTVTGVEEKSVALAPAQRPGKRRLEHIGSSLSDWVMYEVVPSDRHAAFVDLGEADLAKLIPSTPRPEYANDEHDAPESTPPDRLSRVWVPNTEGKGQYDLVADTSSGANAAPAEYKPSPGGAGNYDLLEGKYVDGKFVAGRFYDRPLRDYAVAMRELHRELWEMEDTVLSLGSQVDQMKHSVAGLSGDGGQVAARDAEIASLKSQLERANTEREEISKHAEAVAARIVELNTSIERLIAENKQLANEWTQSQLGAARRPEALSGGPASAR